MNKKKSQRNLIFSPLSNKEGPLSQYSCSGKREGGQCMRVTHTGRQTNWAVGGIWKRKEGDLLRLMCPGLLLLLRATLKPPPPPPPF